MSAPYWSQPGDPFDNPYSNPQMDLTLPALFDAFDALRAAALFADDPDEGATVAETLKAAEMIKFGFEPSTDEAKGLHLLIGAVRRKAAEVPS